MISRTLWGQSSAEQYSTVQYSTVQYSTLYTVQYTVYSTVPKKVRQQILDSSAVLMEYSAAVPVEKRARTWCIVKMANVNCLF